MTGRRREGLSDAQRAQLRTRLASPKRDDSTRIAPRAPDLPYLPLSFQQEQLWFVSQLEALAAYGVHMAVPLTGPLDCAALSRAMTELVRRHEALRTVFTTQGSELSQVVQEARAVVVRIDDLSVFGTEEQERRAASCRAAQTRIPFDLSEGPLFRTRLIRFTPDRHELLLSFHHIITDGWSVGVVMGELCALYASFTEDLPSPLPPPRVQFADYAIWQREQMQGALLDHQRHYWRRQLDGSRAAEVLHDRARATPPSYRALIETFSLEPVVADRARVLARESRATLFMTLLSAFTVLLLRTTGARDLTVGTVVANRRTSELEGLIGCFANVLPIRAVLRPSMRFRDVVACVRDSCLGAYEHQDLPLASLVEECAPGRDVNHNPLFHLMFSAVHAAGDVPEAAGVRFGPARGLSENVRFDLEVQVAETPSTTTVSFAGDADLFDCETVSRLAETFGVVLRALVMDPDQSIDAVPLLALDQQTAVVDRGRGVAAAYPAVSVGALFAGQAAARPAAVAVECGATVLTYAALEGRANQVAQALRQAGVGLESRVGVLLPRGVEQIVALLGVVKAGGAYVALDPADPAGRVAQQLTDAGVAVVVTQPGLVAATVVAARTVIDVAAVGGLPATAPAVEVPADALAYVAFTSGSTGRPKGVEVRHRGVVRLLFGQRYVQLGPEETVLQLAPVSFDASTLEIWGALLHGGRLVIYPERVPEPAALGAALARTGVTTAWLTASLYNTVITQAPEALRGLRQLLIGGEALSVPHVRAGLAALPETTLINGYGPTEATTFTCCYAIPRGQPAAAIPLGGPIAQTETYVLDAGGQLTPPGVPGELYVGGAGLARGYAGAARLTAEKFVPDGVSGAVGARLYRTGDTVRWTADGTLAFLGRRDGQIKLRGYRIELGEVEAALAALPDVAMAAATVHGTGEGRRLVGYVVAQADRSIEPAAIRTALQATLPGYLVPAAIVVLAALPLTAAGKVDRDALPAPPDPATALVAPRSALEQQIAAVWAAVLGRGGLSVDANFFDVGGHSLRLIAVQAQLTAQLGRTIPLVTLFQYPTIAALAGYLTEGEASAPPAVATPPPTEPIAIIGLAGRFPGAPDIEAFWANLRSGTETIRRFTRDELTAAGVPPRLIDDPHFVPARGALDDIDLFDAELFGYSPREAALLDPQQRLLLECAWTALERAGYGPRRQSDLRIGVYAGTSANTYIASAAPAGLEGTSPLQVLVSSDKDFLATRVSYKLELRGPAVTVQTACSTSLVAVHTACHALRAGECDVALAGGVSITVPTVGGYRYTPDGIVSPDGHCRAFDAQAAGTVAGNGVGIVVLKRLANALADGDTVLAVVRGSAINNDGADKVGFTAPSVNGQAAVIAAAQSAAGVAPATISYIEAHGTGTALGDPVEVAALRRVFGDGAGPATCALASVKSNIGHLDAAAGVTALIKVVLALTHRELPPSLHFTSPNPELDLGPFYVPTSLMPWVARDGVPRRAGVSSFGMGGTNAHVIVEETSLRPAAASSRPWHIVPVSGHSQPALDAATEQLASWLALNPGASAADVAFTQQVGRAPLRIRRVAIGRDAPAVAAALRAAPHTVSGGAPPLVWLFPGQGTQLVGMGRALYATEAVFRAEIDACAAALDGLLDRDLRAVLYPESPDAEADAVGRLAQTTWTQVALVAVELGLAALWRSWGVVPAAVIGHSVGELAAACVAGVLTRDSAMQLAADRGRLMHAAPPGGMVAVAAPADEITPRLRADLWLAAVNNAHQCVVAGTWEALDAFEAQLREEGRLTQRLPAAGAFHSGLMNDVVEPLTVAAQRHPVNVPRIPWISTVTGEVIGAAPSTDYWGTQVTAPVQWGAAIDQARAFLSGTPAWLQVGPGHTLIRLVQPLQSGETAIATMDGIDAAEATAAAVAQAWAAGVDVDWTAYHAADMPRQRLVLPTYPFQRRRYWLEASPPRDERGAAQLEKRADIADWLYTPTWKQLPGARFARRDDEHCLLFSDSKESGERLKGVLEARGCVVTTVEPGHDWLERRADAFTLNPAAQDDYVKLLNRLDAVRRFPARIVHAWAMSRTSEGQAREVERGVGSIAALVRAIADSPRAVDLIVVASGTQLVRGDEEIFPTRASVVGLCRVIPQEHPLISCRCVDVDPEPGDAHVALLANELVASSGEPVVALRGSWRWVQQFDPVPATASDGEPYSPPGGPVLITGGLGRIGLTLAAHLARGGATILLVTRSAFPAKADWMHWLDLHPPSDPTSVRIRRLMAIEETGGRLMIVRADVFDRASFGEAVARAEAEAGPVRAVIHAAGATTEDDFAPVRTTDGAVIGRQFMPKVTGTEVLRNVFGDRPLDFCVLMSSVSSVLGGFGFGAYASANESLNKFAVVEASGGRPWISIAWDGWWFGDGDQRGTGEVASLAMTPQEGTAAFDRILNSGWRGTVVVSTADLPARLRRNTQRPTSDATVLSARPLVATAFVEPRNETERAIARVWADALGVERVGVQDNFFELGGHSLLGVHLMSRLSSELGITLSLHDVLMHPTVAALAEVANARKRAGDVVVSTVARALQAVHQMSDEEVDRVLAQS